MENVVRKCLNVREKCFETNSCPIWLLSILPSRIKTVESIVDNDINEQQSKLTPDLSPFKLTNSIPLFPDEKVKNFNINPLTTEYPHDISFENQLFHHSSQLISSPSREQLFYLFTQFKQNEKKKILFQSPLDPKKNQCQEMNCSNHSIPLTKFCPKHLFQNDEKQILFVKCHHCKDITIREDKKNLLHICSYFN